MSLTIPRSYVPTGVTTGSEEIIDPADIDFSGGVGNWIGEDGTLSASGGELMLTRTAGTQRMKLPASKTGAIAGRTYLISAEVKSDDSTVNINIGAGADLSPSVALTSTFQTITHVLESYNGTSDFNTFTNLAVGDTHLLRNPTIKQIDQGANTDGVKYSTFLNGNTVDSNVVTENQGAAIADSILKGAFMEGSVTEASGRSADVANWPNITTASVAQDIVGLLGLPNEAFTVTDNSNSVTQSRQKNTTISDDSSTWFWHWRIPVVGSTPSVFMRLGGRLIGGSVLEQTMIFNAFDGSFVESSTDGTVLHVVQVGDFWFVLFSITNDTSGNVTAIQAFESAYNADGTVTEDVTVQGSSGIAVCELTNDTWSWSPIKTTGGTTKTRLADVGATLDLANFTGADAAGTLEVEPTLFFDVATGAGQGIVTPNTSFTELLLYISGSTAKRIELKDGSNTAVLADSWSATGDTIKLIAPWGDGNMQFESDGVLSNEVSYDGSFTPSVAITLGKGLTLGMAIKNLEIFSTKLGIG